MKSPPPPGYFKIRSPNYCLRGSGNHRCFLNSPPLQNFSPQILAFQILAQHIRLGEKSPPEVPHVWVLLDSDAWLLELHDNSHPDSAVEVIASTAGEEEMEIAKTVAKT